jgi:hypothetical protein
MNTGAALRWVRARRGKACVAHSNQELFVYDYRIRCRFLASIEDRAAGIPKPKKRRYWESDSDSPEEWDGGCDI